MGEAAVPDQEQFAIVSDTERGAEPARVMKQGDTFAVFDPHGDVIARPGSEHGLYHRGTRFLSRCELRVGGRLPLLLSSAISEDNVVFAADMTNPDMRDGPVVIPRGVLHLFRSRVLWEGGWIECVRAVNHGLDPFDVHLTATFDADFADVFEVRGTRRAARGRFLPRSSGSDLVLRYQGLDGIERRTRIECTRPADDVDGDARIFHFTLAPHAAVEFQVTVACELDERIPTPRDFREAVSEPRRRAQTDRDHYCALQSSNQELNQWIGRSAADLRMMRTDTAHGIYPYAGIPWFSTPFGRDGIIAAFELLWAAPEIAHGVLTFLAATQATAMNDAQDAQPGKILHEMRDGEMAALGEIPFGRYYGSADATPLFAALMDAYYERTGDLALIDRLWPHLLAALDWMDVHGDADGDGFIEYARRSESGLLQQGWKDSWDSVFHEDGTLATAPIALCEIQGYAYAAWLGAARLAEARGDSNQATEWRHRAARLQARFEDAFWCEDLGTYALALDADKRPCRVRASNAAHCLFSGIASAPRAHQVADTLLAQTSFSGWGIRTLSSGGARYNPMSYHNGSVWPHDNAIAAAGFARYGLTGPASQIFGALFDLSRAVDLHRLPELICGFHRRTSEAPTLYPVACAPQAWAAGAVYLLVQACLGLRIDAIARRIVFIRSRLPESVDSLRIMNLAVGDATVDLLLTQHTHDVGLTVLRRTGEVEIVATK